MGGRGIGWLRRGAPPQRGRPSVPRLSRLLCCVFYPPQGPTQFSLFSDPRGPGSDAGPLIYPLTLPPGPRMTCHSLYPHFQAAALPFWRGLLCTWIETRAQDPRWTGAASGWKRHAKTHPHGVACTVARVSLLWGWPRPIAPQPTLNGRITAWREGGEKAQRSRAWNLLAC